MDFDNMDEESEDHGGSGLRLELRDTTENTPEASYWLETGVTTVGRNPSGHQVIQLAQDPQCSGNHVELEWFGDEMLHVRDMQSTNGSWISKSAAGVQHYAFTRLRAKNPAGGDQTYAMSTLQQINQQVHTWAGGNVSDNAAVLLAVESHDASARQAADISPDEMSNLDVSLLSFGDALTELKVRSISTCSDIQVECEDLPLIDRYTQCRLKIPCRGQHCVHQEAFELATFVLTARAASARSEPTLCPCCSEPLPLDQLRVDELMLRLVAAVPDEVTISIKNATHYSTGRSKLTNDVIVLDSDSDDDVIVVESGVEVSATSEVFSLLRDLPPVSIPPASLDQAPPGATISVSLVAQAQLLNQMSSSWLVANLNQCGPSLADLLLQRRKLYPFTPSGLDAQLQALKGLGPSKVQTILHSLRAAAAANATRLAVQERREAQEQRQREAAQQQRESREAALQLHKARKAEKQRQNLEVRQEMMRQQKAEKQRQKKREAEETKPATCHISVFSLAGRQQPAYIEAERSAMEGSGCRCLWGLLIPNQCKKNRMFARHCDLAEHLRVKHDGKNGPALVCADQRSNQTKLNGLVRPHISNNSCLVPLLPVKLHGSGWSYHEAEQEAIKLNKALLLKDIGAFSVPSLPNATEGHKRKFEEPALVCTAARTPCLGHIEQTSKTKLGQRVRIRYVGVVRYGVVRYVGSIQGREGEWIGVELEKPTGNNSGFANGVQLFECAFNCGVFTRRERLVVEPGVDLNQSEVVEGQKELETSEPQPSPAPWQPSEHVGQPVGSMRSLHQSSAKDYGVVGVQAPVTAPLAPAPVSTSAALEAANDAHSEQQILIARQIAKKRPALAPLNSPLHHAREERLDEVDDEEEEGEVRDSKLRAKHAPRRGNYDDRQDDCPSKESRRDDRRRDDYRRDGHRDGHRRGDYRSADRQRSPQREPENRDSDRDYHYFRKDYERQRFDRVEGYKPREHQRAPRYDRDHDRGYYDRRQ